MPPIPESRHLTPGFLSVSYYPGRGRIVIWDVDAKGGQLPREEIIETGLHEMAHHMECSGGGSGLEHNSCWEMWVEELGRRYADRACLL